MISAKEDYSSSNTIPKKLFSQFVQKPKKGNSFENNLICNIIILIVFSKFKGYLINKVVKIANF